MPPAAPLLRVHHAAQLPGPLCPRGRPVLYGHTLCPYAQRVLLALLCKGEGFELVQVDLARKPAWFMAQVNPAGLVPALVDGGGAAHVESLDVCRWLDGASAGPSLTPAAPAAAAGMEELLRQAGGIVSAGLDVVAGTTARAWGVGAAPSAAQVRRFEAQSGALAAALERFGGPCLTGPTASLADVALLPFFERFAWALALRGEVDVAALHGGALAAWMAHLHSQPWAALAAPDAGLFASALRRHGSLDFFDYDSYDAFQLSPHLRRPGARSPRRAVREDGRDARQPQRSSGAAMIGQRDDVEAEVLGREPWARDAAESEEGGEDEDDDDEDFDAGEEGGADGGGDDDDGDAEGEEGEEEGSAYEEEAEPGVEMIAVRSAAAARRAPRAPRPAPRAPRPAPRPTRARVPPPPRQGDEPAPEDEEDYEAEPEEDSEGDDEDDEGEEASAPAHKRKREAGDDGEEEEEEEDDEEDEE
ncbi:GSTL3 [Scenedesmus sp. PABB004]|nr:GSTL3 [Scenedesmus sp. PABB004]